MEYKQGFDPQSEESREAPGSAHASKLEPLAGDLVFDASVLPGFLRSEWSTRRQPSEGVLPTQEWRALSQVERVHFEREAVKDYLESKPAEYIQTLESVAQHMNVLNANVEVGMTLCAYNEDAGIGQAVDVLADRVRSTFGDGPDQKVAITIVVNRPVTDDGQRNREDRARLLATMDILDRKKEQYPFLLLDYAAVEAPAPVAGIGMARMLAHDLTVIRTMHPSNQSRSKPFFIQTGDADMTGMSEAYFREIFAELERTDYNRDVYREAPYFPLEEIIKHPLLDSLDFLLTGSLRALAENSQMPWTCGAGILVSLYAHAEGGGVFPFRFSEGIDEDLRIGYHAAAVRPAQDNIGQIETPLFETDPRRYVIAAGETMVQINERGLLDGERFLTREFRHIATGLNTYLDFHGAAIRSERAVTQGDPGWIFNPSEFADALPLRALEVAANSFREYLREELSYDRASYFDPVARSLYEAFRNGEQAHMISNVHYLVHEGEMADRIRSGEHLEEFDSMLREVNELASKLMVSLLRSNGIRCEAIDCDHLPNGGELSAEIPWPIRITDAEEYRQRLKEKVMA